MANQVVKKDGTKEPFSGDKIRKSIELAGKDAGLTPDRIGAVVNEVSNAALMLAASKEEIATSELKDKILEELDRVEPKAAAAWRNHVQSNP
jgi:transcriptional regulator NrdR family protein